MTVALTVTMIVTVIVTVTVTLALCQQPGHTCAQICVHTNIRYYMCENICIHALSAPEYFSIYVYIHIHTYIRSQADKDKNSRLTYDELQDFALRAFGSEPTSIKKVFDRVG